MTAHDDWQVERMQPPEMPPCLCGHEVDYHFLPNGKPTRCLGEQDPENEFCDGFDPTMTCGCERYEPADAEDLRQDEFEEI